MSLVYLDGHFMTPDKATISPMNRGFLFGEGIYEVIPCYNKNMIGLIPHLERLRNGLAFLHITLQYTNSEWLDIFNKLLEAEPSTNVGIYLQVTRGSVPERFHGFPDTCEPTIFAYTFPIKKIAVAEKSLTKPFEVALKLDTRWKHCNIKSTSLLGNVLHFQQGYQSGKDETILFNSDNELTEASSSNVFIVKGNKISTPVADNQILPGVTRLILLDILRTHSQFVVEERVISIEELKNADEVWLTSSTKEVVPVVKVGEHQIGNGEIGDSWLMAQGLFSKFKFDY